MESAQQSGSGRLHSDDEAVATHHGSEQQGSSQPTGSTTTKSKRRTRGLTRMKNLALSEGTAAPQRLPVTFDADLNPEGDNGAKLISYIGATARSKISILSNDWRLVDDKLKNEIWEEILLTFDIPPTDEIKKMVKKRAGDRWRDFKTKLTREYIRGGKKGGNPMAEYPFISDEVWEDFKKSREDPKFLKLSEANKERQRRNVYPHYMARSGYKGLEKAMMAEQLKAAEASSTLDPAVGAPSLEHPSREQKWKAARVKKGKYITPESAEVAQRIVSI